MQSVENFYNELSGRYSELISKCVPQYDEMLRNLFYYLPDDVHPKRILDLGCGTGNLTAFTLHYFPDTEIHALDISANVLNECRKRFAGYTNIHYHQQDFSQLDFEDESFDLVISSISIHHIDDEEKANLYQNIYQILNPDGVFTFADQTRGVTEEIHQKHIARWKKEALKLGSTEAEWQLWMTHQEAHDHHTPVYWHLQQLENAGFTDIDVIWKNIMWTVISGRK